MRINILNFILYITNIKNHDTMYHVGERLPPYIKIGNRTNTR